MVLHKNLRPTPFCDLILNFPFLKDKINLEDTLDMQIAEVLAGSPLPQIENFNSYIRLNNGYTLPRIVFGIKHTAFKDLYLKAQGLVPAGSNHITALKINLGIKNGILFPVFIPICTVNDGNNNYTVIEYTEQYTYNYSAGLFEKCDDWKTLISDYQTSIAIRHNGGPQFENYILNSDSEAIIYPFQTIYTMILDSSPYPFVLLTNSLATDKNSGALLCQHSILLMATSSSIGIIGHNVYANRSHLCPPCNIISDFDIIRLGPTTCP